MLPSAGEQKKKKQISKEERERETKRVIKK